MIEQGHSMNQNVLNSNFRRPGGSTVRLFLALAAFAAFAISAALPAHSATRTWVCQWANNNWNVSTNWLPVGVPQNGDDLVFPGSARFDSINNMAALKVRAVTITAGVEIFGNAFTVSNSIIWTAGGFSRVAADLTLGGNVTITAPSASVRMGNINLNGFDLTLDFANNLEIEGSISGTGDVTKNGAGRLLLGGSGDNSFNGTFYHYGGELWAAKSPCFPGHFFSNGHTIVYSGGVFSPNHDIVLLSGALVESNTDYSNACANLTMVGARIEAFQMTLTVRSNIIVNASATTSEIIAKLDLGNTGHVIQIANGPATPDLGINYAGIIGGANGGFTKTGPGTLRCVQQSSSQGGLTVISNGVVEAGDFGSPLGTGRTIVHSNATLRLLGPGGGISNPLELHGTGVNGTNGALHIVGGGSTLQSSITVPFGATIRSESTVHAHSVLAGAGDIRFSGPGEFWNHGAANTLTGDIIIESGLFMLDKFNGSSVNPNSTIHVGTNGIFGGGAIAVLRNYESNQITGPVMIRSGSRWEIGSDTFEGAANVTMLGNAEILANGGTFQLDGTLTVQPQPGGSTARIHGGTVSFGAGATRTIAVQDIGGSPDNIELIISPSLLGGSAPVVKTGSGDLRISGLLSYNSPITVDAGDLRADIFGSLGTGTGATIVTNTGRLILEGASFDQEPLIINGGGGHDTDTGNIVIPDSSSWRAPITLNAELRAYAAAGQTWTVNSPISGSSAFVATGPGTVIFDWDTANTYTGSTWVRDGELRLTRDVANVAVPGDLYIGDNQGAAGSARVTTAPPNAQIADTSDVFIYPDGRLVITNTPAVEIIRTLRGSGEIIVSNATLRLNDSGSDSDYSGTFRGNGDLIKAGSGTFTMNGFCRLDGGVLSMFGGTTIIDGTMDGAPTPTLIDAYSGTALEGDGIAENVNVRSGAVLSPGPGYERFTADNVTLLPNANLFLEINGPTAGTTHDQLVARSSLSVTNAFLTLGLHYAPVEGDVITLVNNQSATPVRGTFSGRPQGSVFNEAGTTFLLSYTGGDGNDITLTVTNTELALASVRITGGNGNGVLDVGECNDLSLVLSNKSGLTLSGVSATLDSLTPGVIITKQQSGYPTFAVGSSRTNLTPFRISTTPEFTCGTVVQLRLTVNLGLQGSFTIPISLPSGTPGVVREFAPLILFPLSIPDLSSATSHVAVSAFNARIAKATVSLHLNHTFVGDLNLTLVSPLGKTVRLAARRGSSGDGYGTNCSPVTARTTFDDSSRNLLTAFVAPYVGTFKPEEPLAEFIGDEGNGLWALVLEDAAANDTGALVCWTLTLTPANCSGGAALPCDSCLPLVSGSIRSGSPTLTDRLIRDGRPSLCGDAKTCPGEANVAGAYRYVTHTFTNNGPATCVTVVMRNSCTNASLFASAYYSPFNPADLCANYLADVGVSGALSTMSFPVYANGVFTIVVNEVTPGGGCGNYNFEVHGLPCPPPVLHIAPATPGKVRLYWNYAGGEGYALQSTTNLLNGGATIFTNVPGTPALIGNTFNVTNATGGQRQFYRLVK